MGKDKPGLHRAEIKEDPGEGEEVQPRGNPYKGRG